MAYYDSRLASSTPVVGAFVLLVSLTVLSIGWASSISLAASFVVAVFLILPGLLILSDQDLTGIERLVLVPAVGLSCAAISTTLVLFASMTGLVQRPLFDPLVLLSVTILPTVVSLVVWARRESPSVPTVALQPWMLLGLVPIALGVVGSVVQNYTGETIHNYVITVLLVALVPLLVYQADSELRAGVYLYGFALGVLLSHSLVTPYAVGVDVHASLHTVDTLLATGEWTLSDVTLESASEVTEISDLVSAFDPGLPHDSLPVIVGVPAVLARVGNVPPDYIFKLVYAVLFALTPVGIFRVGREYLSVRDAMIAGMLFIVYYRFFHTSPGKQHMAQFVLVALIVLWHVDVKENLRGYAVVLLSLGIVFAHYAVTFLAIGIFFLAYVTSRWFSVNRLRSHPSLEFVVIFSSLSTGWYLFATGGQKPLQAISAIAISIQQIMTQGSTTRSGVSVATEQTSVVDRLNFVLHGLIFAAIALGILYVLYHAYRNKRPLFSTSVDSTAVGFFGVLSFTIVGSGYLGIDRVLDISLIVLAPIAVVGLREGLTISDKILSLITKNVERTELRSTVSHVGILFIVVLLLFNSGIAYELGDDPASSAVNLYEDPNSNLFTEEEFEAARWLLDHKENGSTVYVDTRSVLPFKRLNARLTDIDNVKDYDGSYAVDWDNPDYIYIRRSAVTQEKYETTPRGQIQQSQYVRILNNNEVVYRDQGVVIVRISPAGRNQYDAVISDYDTSKYTRARAK